MKTEPPSKTFCPLPWMHLFVDEQGMMRPCCMALEEREAMNRDANGDPYFVYQSDKLDEAWNSEYMKGVRKTMLKGGRPKACSRCFQEEDLGIKSYREDSNKMFDHLVEDCLEATDEEGNVPTSQIKSFDIRLGNLCNLRCRMCSFVSSKGLIPEFASFHGVSPRTAKLERFRKMDWYTHPNFWSMFSDYAPHIERLHFAGGEPLLVGEMFKFLEFLVDEGHAENIVLSYVTNMTVWPDRIYELWPKFKRVSITASLDGPEDVNSFIRYPARWPQLEKNLRQLDQDAKKLRCSVRINTTVQVYNIFALDRLIEFADTFENFVRPLRLSILNYPSYFSVRILDDPLKKAAARRLEDFVSRFETQLKSWDPDDAKRLHEGVNGVLRYMQEKDMSDELPNFRKWSNHFDKSRGMVTSDVIPELAPLFSD